MPPTPSPAPSPAEPTPLPQLPATNVHQYAHGISLLGGWLPLTIEIVAVGTLIVAIGWRRTRRWWMVWLPVCVMVGVLGVLGALAARTYVNSEGLASDPAPFYLWVWTGIFAAGVAVAVLGWRGNSWWRRGVALLAIPLTLLTALLALNKWVGYYPSVQAAWGALTAGPLPNQIDAADLPGLRNTVQTNGKLVEVDIPSEASGFKHRSEYVYLPPAWFAGPTPPRLPVIMMAAGEFNTPADWMRSGNAMPIIDGYAQSHGGMAPIFVFVDTGGSFTTTPNASTVPAATPPTISLRTSGLMSSTISARPIRPPTGRWSAGRWAAPAPST